MKKVNGPSALLLISTHCPHCHIMQELLLQRVADGCLDGLDVINIDESLEQAQAYNVRSVPWLKLNSFEFDHALTPAELDRWITKTTSADANTEYLEYLLQNGKLGQAIARLDQGLASFAELLPLIIKDDVKMNVRIGVGALFEHYEGETAITSIVGELAVMADHLNPMVRADVCHYLMLTRTPESREIIERMLHDKDTQVREIAHDSLAEFDTAQ